MPTKQEAWDRFLEYMHGPREAPDKKNCWHFGKCEMAELLDYIYGADNVPNKRP